MSWALTPIMGAIRSWLPRRESGEAYQAEAPVPDPPVADPSAWSVSVQNEVPTRKKKISARRAHLWLRTRTAATGDRAKLTFGPTVRVATKAALGNKWKVCIRRKLPLFMASVFARRIAVGDKVEVTYRRGNRQTKARTRQGIVTWSDRKAFRLATDDGYQLTIPSSDVDVIRLRVIISPSFFSPVFSNSSSSTTTAPRSSQRTSHRHHHHHHHHRDSSPSPSFFDPRGAPLASPAALHLLSSTTTEVRSSPNSQKTSHHHHRRDSSSSPSLIDTRGPSADPAVSSPTTSFYSTISQPTSHLHHRVYNNEGPHADPAVLQGDAAHLQQALAPVFRRFPDPPLPPVSLSSAFDPLRRPFDHPYIPLTSTTPLRHRSLAAREPLHTMFSSVPLGARVRTVTVRTCHGAANSTFVLRGTVVGYLKKASGLIVKYDEPFGRTLPVPANGNARTVSWSVEKPNSESAAWHTRERLRATLSRAPRSKAIEPRAASLLRGDPEPRSTQASPSPQTPYDAAMQSGAPSPSPLLPTPPRPPSSPPLLSLPALSPVVADVAPLLPSPPLLALPTQVEAAAPLLPSPLVHSSSSSSTPTPLSPPVLPLPDNDDFSVEVPEVLDSPSGSPRRSVTLSLPEVRPRVGIPNQPVREVSSPPRASIRQGLNVATFNVRTLQDPRKIDGLIEWAGRCRLDIICLQETCILSDDFPAEAFPGGWCFVSWPANERGRCGVACLLTPSAASCLRSHEVLIPHRVGIVRLADVDIVCVYAPTRESPEAQDLFYTELLHKLDGLPPSRPLIIAGDFNAPLLHDSHRANRSGPSNVAAANRLNDFMQGLSLVSVQDKYRPHPPIRTSGGNTIDHILVRRRFASSIGAAASPYVIIDSDHRPLTCHIRVRWARTIRAAKPPKPDIDRLAYDPDLRTSFNRELASQVDDLTLLTYPSFLTAVTAASQTLPLAQPHPKAGRSWSAPEVQRVIEQANAGHVDTRRAMDALLKAISKAKKDDSTKLINQFTRLLDRNPWGAWKCVFASGRTHHCVEIPDTPEVTTRFTDHFRNLLQDAPSRPSGDRLMLPAWQPPHGQRAPLVFKTGPITVEEVSEAVLAMSTHRATSLDHLAVEVCKVPSAQKALALIFSEALAAECTPDEFNHAILVPLYKKGDANDPSNFRGIALQSVAAKLLFRIIMCRLRDPIDPFLLPHQAAYRPGRNTAQHVATVNALIYTARARQNYGLHLTFIDFKKAFDSVSRDVIEDILIWWGVPPPLRALILKFWRSVKLHLRLRVNTEPVAQFSTVSGVLQGDTLSPFIFDIVIDTILRFVPEDTGVTISNSNRQHTPHGLSKLAYLAYADDIVLISHTIADATRQLHALERAAKSVGLYLNFGKGKTERMTFGDFAEGPLSLADGTPVPQVTSYKYLGVVLGEDWLSDLAARKRRAWCSVRKFRNIWKSHVDDSTKRLLYEAIVFPFFAYGALTWPTLRSSDDALHHSATRMLRYCMGYKLDGDDLDASPHTEQLWGPSFLPVATIRRHRLKELGHWIREHNSGIRTHVAVQVLTWWPSIDRWPRRPGGQLRTLQASLCLDAGFEDQDNPGRAAARMYRAATDRTTWRNLTRRATLDMERDQRRRLQQERTRAARAAVDYSTHAPDAKADLLCARYVRRKHRYRRSKQKPPF